MTFFPSTHLINHFYEIFYVLMFLENPETLPFLSYTSHSLIFVFLQPLLYIFLDFYLIISYYPSDKILHRLLYFYTFILYFTHCTFYYYHYSLTNPRIDWLTSVVYHRVSKWLQGRSDNTDSHWIWILWDYIFWYHLFPVY